MTAREEATGDVAVIVTHYRSPEDLVENVSSIAKYGGDRVGEVWIVDSEAIAGVRDAVHEIMPSAHYLPFRLNVGYAALVNMGVAASSTPYVMVMNADVMLNPGCIDTLASELDHTPDIGVLAPQLRYSDDSLQHSTFAFYRPSTVLVRRTVLGKIRWGRRELRRFLDEETVSDALASGMPTDVDWSLGAAMMIRRQTLEEVGPLDEEYFLYFEDVDWCLRAWQSGWRCAYLPTATCKHHYARASAAGGMLGLLTNRLTRRHIRSAVRFFRLHGLSVTRPSLPPARMAQSSDSAGQTAPVASRRTEHLVGRSGG
jgi:hypothetical protein